jgi:drug/metabolite transporter (DMT)-like permease
VVNFRFDINKTLSQTGDSLKRLSVLNPLTIRKKGTRSKAIFALAMVCFFWGTTWVASKEGVRHMPALELAGIRQLLGGLCFIAYFLYKGESWPKGKEWRPIIVLSFLNFFMSNALSTWGVQYINAGLAAIMGAIFPLWIVIIGLFASSGKIPSKAITGLILGFGGVCVIFYEPLLHGDFSKPGFLKGVLLSLVATWSWAFGTLYTKKQAASFNPYFSLGLQMIISSIPLLLITQTTDIGIPFTAIPWKSWAAIGYLIIFSSIITFISYIYALQHLPTVQVSVYAYINPIVAVLLGAALFGERLNLFIGAGGAITLLGVYLVNRTYKALPPAEQPESEGV